MSLTLQMVIATFLGIFTGLFFGEKCAGLATWTSAYISILKITIIPYLVFAIMHGVGQLRLGQAKLIVKRGLIFILLIWSVNILLIYYGKSLFPVGSGLSYARYIPETQDKINFAQLLIPENIFYALSHNIIPAIVVFSILIGIALMTVKEKITFMTLLSNLVEVLNKITSWIAKITPIGTFLVIAQQVGTAQFSTMKQVSTYIAIYVMVLCLAIFWVIPRVLSLLTNIKAASWIKLMLPALVLAYTTNVIIVSLPYIIAMMQKKLREDHPEDEEMPSYVQGTVSVVFNLPLSSLFIAMFVFFAALFYNLPLYAPDQAHLFATIFLISLGTVGMGSWVNNITFLLDSLGLPRDGIDLFLTSLPFTTGFQSMLSVMEISVLAFLVTLYSRRMFHFDFKKIFTHTAITLIPLALIATFLHIYNPLPKIQNLSLSLIDLPAPKPFKAKETNPLLQEGKPIQGKLAQIIQRGKLTVGYSDKTPPFALINKHQEITGFDICYAYELAKDLGCELELVPLSFGSLAEDIQANKYDIAIAPISINAARLQQISFSQPYFASRNVFLTKKKNKKLFISYDVLKRTKNFSLGVLKGSALVETASKAFPKAHIVEIDDVDQWAQNPTTDAILCSEPEAIFYASKHIQYKMVAFDFPGSKESLSFATSQHEFAWINYINEWIEWKVNSGFAQKSYDIWILGKIPAVRKRETRWSILDDVIKAPKNP